MKNTKIWFLIILCFISIACSEKINPYAMKVEAGKDLNPEQAPLELMRIQAKSVFFTFQGQNESVACKKTFNLIQSVFLNSSGMKEVKENLPTQAIAEALNLADKLGANYVVLIKCEKSKEFKAGDELAHFSSGFFSTFSTNTRREVLSKPYDYDSLKTSDLTKFVRKLVFQYFPPKGFVMASRGGGKVVQVSMGANSGVKSGLGVIFRKFTTIKASDSGKSNFLTSTTRIDYSKEVVAEGEVLWVNEDTSWIELSDEFVGKINFELAAFPTP